MKYLVSYDLRNAPRKKYDDLKRILRSLYGKHLLESVWVVEYEGEAGGLRDYLLLFMDDNTSAGDGIVVGRVEPFDATTFAAKRLIT